MAEQRVGIEIVAKDAASAAIGRARLDVERYTAEIAKLKREAAGGANVSRDLGNAMLAQSSAAKNLRASLDSATGGTALLKSAAQGAGDALAQQSGPVGRIAASLGIMGTAAGIAAVGVAAVAGALVAGAKGIASYQEQLDLVSETTGLTTGQLAGLKVAASENGRSFEQIRPALDFFTRKIGEVAAGTPDAVQAFFDLGVAVRDADGAIRPTGDILKDAQVRLSAMGTAAERSKAAMELFGRSGAASLSILLTPLDEAEAKARKLGLALGPEAEATARKADAAFDTLATSLQGIANAFGVVAAQVAGPFLTSLAQAMSGIAAFMNSPEVQAFMKFQALGSGGGTPLSRAQERAAKNGLVLDERGNVVEDAKDFTFQTNRPWDSNFGKDWLPPEAPKSKPWAQDPMEMARINALDSSLGAMNTLPGLKPINPQWSPGGTEASDPRFLEALKGAKEEADRLNKSLEGFVDIGEQAATQTGNFEKQLTALEVALGTGVANVFGETVSMMIRGTADIAKAFESLVVDTLASIAGQAVQKGVMSLFGLPFQHGGTFAFQAGGTVSSFPLMAQSGLVVAGTRGMDTVPAMLGRGETVISHALTDRLSEFLTQTKSILNRQPAQASATAGDVTVHLTYSGGGFGDRDRLKLTQWTRDEFLPVLRDVMGRGARA